MHQLSKVAVGLAGVAKDFAENSSGSTRQGELAREGLSLLCSLPAPIRLLPDNLPDDFTRPPFKMHRLFAAENPESSKTAVNGLKNGGRIAVGRGGGFFLSLKGSASRVKQWRCEERLFPLTIESCLSASSIHSV
jgi:hypothetical protein